MTTLKRFTNEQRIIVHDPGSPIHGWLGTVKRLRRCDDMAFVHLDQRYEGLETDEIHPFPPDDPTRSTSTLLHPSQTKAAP